MTTKEHSKRLFSMLKGFLKSAFIFEIVYLFSTSHFSEYYSMEITCHTSFSKIKSLATLDTCSFCV